MKQLSEEDNETLADMVFEVLEKRSRDFKHLPNHTTVLRGLRRNFDLGLLEARNICQRVADKYLTQLRAMGYSVDRLGYSISGCEMDSAEASEFERTLS